MKNGGPPSLLIDCDRLKELETESYLSVVFFGDPESKEFKEIYLDQTKYHKDYDFYHIKEDQECLSRYTITKTPALVMLRKYDFSPYYYEGNFYRSSVA